MLVFHSEFSGEISSTDLKLLVSQGFSQIDYIIQGTFHSPRYLEDGP